MRLALFSLATLPLAFAPLGCGQPAGQVSDQSDEYSTSYESTGNEETAADKAPQLDTHEVHRESLDAAESTDEMTVQNEQAAEAGAEEQGKETNAEASHVSTADAEQQAKKQSDKQSEEQAPAVKPEEVADQQESTFKDESAEQSAHVDPPQSALEVSLEEVEQELTQAKQTLAKYSTQQEKKDFRNGAQKLLDENLDSNKSLKDEIARLESELQQKQQRLESITTLTDQIQAQIDQLDPTSAEPDEQLRTEIKESLSRLQRLKSESDRRVAQQD